MGQISPLSYRSDNSILFRLDVRCKIICICFLSILTPMANFLHLSLISVILLWFLYNSGVQIKTFIRELKYCFIMLMFLFAVRVLVTHDALDGTKIVWRFLIIMIIGILFSSSTNASSIRGAVMWFLKPIPLIPEKRVGVMVSLFVRFLPLILEKAHEVSDAQKSRCAHLQRNPIKKIKNLTIPLLNKVFNSADALAMAMTARCYSDNRTERTKHYFSRSGYETYFYIGVIMFSASILYYRA